MWQDRSAADALSIARVLHSQLAPPALQTLRVLQIDFAFPGPYGDELSTAVAPLADRIAATEGLVWKIWTENRETGRAGGIYLFTSEEALAAYLTEHRVRLASFGVCDVRAEIFCVNAPLSRADRAPLPEP